MELQGMTDELAQRLVEQGYLSYDDLSVIEPDALMEMGGMTEEQVDAIVEQADARAEEAERIAEEQKKLKKAQDLARSDGCQPKSSRRSSAASATAVAEAPPTTEEASPAEAAVDAETPAEVEEPSEKTESESAVNGRNGRS